MRVVVVPGPRAIEGFRPTDRCRYCGSSDCQLLDSWVSNFMSIWTSRRCRWHARNRPIRYSDCCRVFEAVVGLLLNRIRSRIFTVDAVLQGRSATAWSVAARDLHRRDNAGNIPCTCRSSIVIKPLGAISPLNVVAELDRIIESLRTVSTAVGGSVVVAGSSSAVELLSKGKPFTSQRVRLLVVNCRRFGG
jgi:hypothetical protein